MKPEQAILATMGASALTMTVMAPFALKDSFSKSLETVTVSVNGTTYDVTETLTSLGTAGITLVLAALFALALFPARRATSEILLSR